MLVSLTEKDVSFIKTALEDLIAKNEDRAITEEYDKCYAVANAFRIDAYYCKKTLEKIKSL